MSADGVISTRLTLRPRSSMPRMRPASRERSSPPRTTLMPPRLSAAADQNLGLDDDRIPEALRGLERVLHARGDLTGRYRDPRGPKELLGLVFVQVQRLVFTRAAFRAARFMPPAPRPASLVVPRLAPAFLSPAASTRSSISRMTSSSFGLPISSSS